MKKNLPDIFIVLGYGVPKNILVDENYNCYLKQVFNKIYSQAVSDLIKKPSIIFTGGNTDIRKPYKKTEAQEILRLFKSYTNRFFLKEITKDWIFVADNKALSTLENLLFASKKLAKKRISKANLYIFCEQTREKKVKILARKVFKENFRITIYPIDFDFSANRYLSPKFINQKEAQDISFGLWALKSPQNYKKYHQIFEERLAYFRKLGPEKHVQAIQEWWRKKLDELIN